MPPQEESFDPGPLQECQMSSCNRVARVSVGVGASDWYTLCHPCSDAYTTGAVAAGGSYSMIMPPYDGEMLERAREGSPPPSE